MSDQHLGSCSRKTPLDIFEIRTHIGQFLKPGALHSCILVCKAWQASFTPILWRTVKLIDYNAKRTPARSVFEKHANMIRHLSVGCNTTADHLDTAALCIHLHTLSIWVYVDRLVEVDVAPVLSSNKNLVVLRLYGGAFDKIHGLYFHTFLPHLQHLHLSHVELMSLRDESLSAQEHESFLCLFQSVKTLSLRKVVFPSLNLVRLPSEPSHAIQSLCLREAWSTSLVPFLGHFFGPNLTHFAWLNSRDMVFYSHVIGLFQRMPLKSLERLSLHRLESFKEPGLELIFQSIDSPLKVLDCEKVDFSDKSWRYLVRHGIHLTLEELRLDRCMGLSEEVVQDILECCPSLIKLDLPGVTAEYVWRRQQILGKGTTWACTGLRSLRIDFIFGLELTAVEMSEKQMAVHREIGALHQLRGLDLLDEGKGPGLSLHLGEGLEAWVDMACLEKVNLGSRYAAMDRSDVTWLKSHCLRLGCLMGQLSMDEQDHANVNRFYYDGVDEENDSEE